MCILCDFCWPFNVVNAFILLFNDYYKLISRKKYNRNTVIKSYFQWIRIKNVNKSLNRKKWTKQSYPSSVVDELFWFTNRVKFLIFVLWSFERAFSWTKCWQNKWRNNSAYRFFRFIRFIWNFGAIWCFTSLHIDCLSFSQYSRLDHIRPHHFSQVIQFNQQRYCSSNPVSLLSYCTKNSYNSFVWQQMLWFFTSRMNVFVA